MKVAVIRSAVALALLTAPLAAAPAGAASLPPKKTVASVPKRPVAKQRASALSAAFPYEAKLLSCRVSSRIEERVVTVGASMMPVPGSKRLALRLDLQQKPLSGGRWTTRADVPGLGIWTAPSDPSIGTRTNDVYRYRQAVGRLVVPVAYRFRVSFRWSDAAGRVVRETKLYTGPCRQPDLRPDLVISEARATRGADASTALWAVTVKNVGRGFAGTVGVGATFTSETRTIRKLSPGESAQVTFTGPACSELLTPPTFLVDPFNVIDETRESNNSLSATCPATLDGP